MSGSSLSSDPSALARVETEALGGTVEQVHATGPDGKPIPIAVKDGRLIPEEMLSPGEEVSVDVVVKRPGRGRLAGRRNEGGAPHPARPRGAGPQPLADRQPRLDPQVTFDQPVRVGRLRRPRPPPPPRLLPPAQVGQPRLPGCRRHRHRRRRAAHLGAPRQAAERHLVPGQQGAERRRQPGSGDRRLPGDAAAPDLLQAGPQGARRRQAEARPGQPPAAGTRSTATPCSSRPPATAPGSAPRSKSSCRRRSP